MVSNLVRVSITVEQDIWDRVSEESKKSENQRASGAQAGIILKKYFDFKDKIEVSK